MQFDGSFFKEETRCDFVISSDMKHAWAAQMEILSDIELVCYKLGITCFAFWGTMLGAVRHKGFIPWDDDIDLAMKRSDFERFKREASAYLPEFYVINTLYTEDPERRRDDHLMRVNNGDMIRFDDTFLKKFHGCPYVCGIDIYALDYLPPDKNQESLLRSLLKSISLIRETIRIMHAVPREFEEELAMIGEFAGSSLSTDPNLLYQELLVLSDRLFMSYGEDEASEITTYARNLIYPGFRFQKESFDDPVWMDFENMQVSVAADYDTVLKVLFGANYMMPKYWASHDYPFYKPQQEQIREMLGYVPILTLPD